MYYLRTRPAAEPIKFTIDKARVRALIDVSSTLNKPVDTIDEAVEAMEEMKIMEEIRKRNMEAISCSITNPEGCLSCQG